MKSFQLMAALFAAFALSSCDVVDSGDAPKTATAEQKVLNGSDENAFEAVCALVRQDGNKHYNVLASGVLIDSQWVLSVASNEKLDTMSDADILGLRFAFGPDVNDSNAVRFAEIDRVERFPYMLRGWNFYNRYYPGQYFLHYNNIALWHLETPVTDITPMPISDADNDVWMDGELTLVGYGASQAEFVTNELGETGVAGDKAGTDGKRLAANLLLSRPEIYGSGSNMLLYDPHGLEVNEEGKGAAYGDSGAPVLFHNGENYELVGSVANSNYIGDNPTEILREFKGWISSVMSDTPMDCTSDPDICSCPEACTESGVCNNWECNSYIEYEDCFSLFSKWGELYQDSKLMTPYFFWEDYIATFSAVRKNLDVWNCALDETLCDDFNRTLGICYADGEMEADCFDALHCDSLCEDDDCVEACRSASALSEPAIEDFWWLVLCVLDLPEEDRGNAGIVHQQCGEALDACYVADDCDVFSNGCDAGKVCVLSVYGEPVCRKSGNKALDEACWVGSSDCAEGLTCAPKGEAQSVCVKLCKAESDCGELACKKDTQTARWLGEDIGYCTDPSTVCIDKDNDGYCSTNDCDDNNNQIHPNSQEICGNNTDDNCNGQIDEGCGSDPDGGSEADAGDAGIDDGGSESDAGDAGEETDAADAVVIDDATTVDGGDAGSDDASNASNDSGSSDKPNSDDASRPSTDDAGSADDDDDGGDDGCSAVPGTRSGSWLAFLGLPLLAIRRRRRA